jgi:hypothetical protein
LSYRLDEIQGLTISSEDSVDVLLGVDDALEILRRDGPNTRRNRRWWLLLLLLQREPSDCLVLAGDSVLLDHVLFIANHVR